ncbi:MAG: HlyD family efflux transporter periplasmic adaptor subunit [bacterium]
MKKISKKIYIIILIIVVASIGGYYYFNKSPKISYDTAVVQLGTVTQSVSETGSVKRASEINLNFLAQGRLASSSVKVGDKVKKGQILAELDNLSSKLQVEQATANLNVAKANEKKVLNGATSQDIKVSQTTLNQAMTNYQNAIKDYAKIKTTTDEAIMQAQKNLNDIESQISDTSPLLQAVKSAESSLENSKNTYQKAIDNKKSLALSTMNDKVSVAKSSLELVDRILANESAKDTLGILDSSVLNKVKNSLLGSRSLMNKFDDTLLKANNDASNTNITQALDSAGTLMSGVSMTLDATFGLLEKTITSSKLSVSALDALKASVTAQLSIANGAVASIQLVNQGFSDAALAYDSAISTASNGLSAAKANYNSGLQSAKNVFNNAKISQSQQLTSAQSRIDAALDGQKIAQAQLNKISSHARSEDIDLVSAQVDQAQANLAAAINQANNGVIRAPFDGEILQVNYLVGEEPMANKPVIIMQGVDFFEIEVDISESDIAKLSIGNSVSVDFDAFGGEVKFEGKLISIDPSQTIIQEVVYYKCKISDIKPAEGFEKYNNLIKPGMTANIVILAQKKENTMFVPNRVILEKSDNTKVIRVVKGVEIIEQPVRVGMRGDDGLTEILSGVVVGDKVVLAINGQ